MEEDARVDTHDAHPLSEKQTDTSMAKVATTTAILTDPRFPLPTLTSSTSTFRYVQSFTVLSLLIVAAVLGAWFYEATVIQLAADRVGLIWVVGGVAAGLMGVLFVTGTVWVDWWELVLGYWWLSIPVGAAAGLAFILNQESASVVNELN